jgi:hypothetical protein
MKFDMEKRAAELLFSDQSTIPIDQFGDHFQKKAIQLARETAAAIVAELIGFGHSSVGPVVAIARRYATTPPAAAPTPEAIEEVKIVLRNLGKLDAEPTRLNWTLFQISAYARAALAKLDCCDPEDRAAPRPKGAGEGRS